MPEDRVEVNAFEANLFKDAEKYDAAGIDGCFVVNFSSIRLVFDKHKDKTNVQSVTEFVGKLDFGEVRTEYRVLETLAYLKNRGYHAEYFIMFNPGKFFLDGLVLMLMSKVASFMAYREIKKMYNIGKTCNCGGH